MFKYLKAVLIVLIFSAVIFTGCKKNKAPDKPSTPTGPTSGSKNTEYTFASSAEDPDDDSVAIRFDWGDGDTSDWSDWQASEDSISMTHSWSDSGSYTIRAQAQDLKEAVSPWSSSHTITISTHIANNPPSTPITPVGTSTGMVNVSYSFNSTATDLDGDSVAIRFDWGDGDTSNWSTWQTIEDSISMSHSWSDTGMYIIKAQAKDKKDATSNWSSGHPIDITSVGWYKTFGGSGSDWGKSVQQTSDGGYIITGSTNSYGHGRTDAYLIKTDPIGDTQWTRTFGGSDNDVGYSVLQTTDGGYLTVGYTYSFGGLCQVYLIKTDANGEEQWIKTTGFSDHADLGYSVQQTTDGGYIIAGTTYIGVSNADFYLIKTNASGDTLWTRTFGGTGLDGANSVQQTLDGGFIIVGYIQESDNDDIFLIKTDANGTESWNRHFGGGLDDCGYSIQQTTDGGYIITGSTESYGAGQKDVYLIKTDSIGNQIWYKTFGGSFNDYGYSVQQISDGGYIITGYTKSYGAGQFDVYLIKTDIDGDSCWTKTFGGSASDWGYAVQQTTDGGYIITGDTGSSGAGGEDVYLIKTDANGNTK